MVTRSLSRTARSRQPDAVGVVLRKPAITAGELASLPRNFPFNHRGRGAKDRRHCCEATGRASRRAFSLNG
jgi:hypothetical protein